MCVGICIHIHIPKHIYIYVSCVWVYVSVYVYVSCVWVYVSAVTHELRSSLARRNTYSSICIQIHVYAHLYMHIWACTHTHAHTHTNARTHTNAHTHTHTFIHFLTSFEYLLYIYMYTCMHSDASIFTNLILGLPQSLFADPEATEKTIHTYRK